MTRHSGFMKGFSEAYLADLGRVIAAWSHIEGLFNFLFVSLVVDRGRNQASTLDRELTKVGQSFNRRINMFRERLAELELAPELRAKALKLLDRLMKLRDERDEVAHSLWTPFLSEEGEYMPDKARAYFKSWRNSKPGEWNIVSQERLKEAFEKMAAVLWDLDELSLDEELHAQRPRQSSA